MKARAPRARVRGSLVRAGLVLALCGLTLVPAALEFVSHGEGAETLEAAHAADRRAAAFKVRGRVTGLSPGARAVMRLRITNPNSFSIRVGSLEVRALDSDHSGCGKRWMKLQRRLDLSLKVPKRGRASAYYPVQLSKNAPDACQGGRWPLRIKGTAERIR